MIRIRSILNKISFLVFFLSISTILNGQVSLGAKGLSLGQATTALSENKWSLFANPSLLNTSEATLGFYGLRNYGFSELTDMATFGSLPTKLGTGSLGFHRYGDTLFNETRVRLGYKNEWENLHFGLVLNYNHISFGGPYGSGGALGLDLGIASQVMNRIWIGAKATNINKPAYTFTGTTEDLARELSVGFSYELEQKALFIFDVVKDVRFPVAYRGGLEMVLIQELKGRIGITTEPLTYSFGVGYGKEFWEINLAVQQHSYLGMSPGFDLLIHF